MISKFLILKIEIQRGDPWKFGNLGKIKKTRFWGTDVDLKLMKMGMYGSFGKHVDAILSAYCG